MNLKEEFIAQFYNELLRSLPVVYLYKMPCFYTILYTYTVIVHKNLIQYSETGRDTWTSNYFPHLAFSKVLEYLIAVNVLKYVPIYMMSILTPPVWIFSVFTFPLLIN